MSDQLIYGIFEDEEEMVEAAQELRRKNIIIDEFYTPFPVHGLDELLGLGRSKLPYVCFGAAALGLGLGLYLQYWISAVSWPMNIGGKPFFSLPAFIPITFELTILFGALITVGVFFWVFKLFPGKKVDLVHPRVTDDTFVMAIKKGPDNLSLIEEILKGHGAKEIQ